MEPVEEREVGSPMSQFLLAAELRQLTTQGSACNGAGCACGSNFMPF